MIVGTPRPSCPEPQPTAVDVLHSLLASSGLPAVLSRGAQAVDGPVRQDGGRTKHVDAALVVGQVRKNVRTSVADVEPLGPLSDTCVGWANRCRVVWPGSPRHLLLVSPYRGEEWCSPLVRRTRVRNSGRRWRVALGEWGSFPQRRGGGVSHRDRHWCPASTAPHRAGGADRADDVALAYRQPRVPCRPEGRRRGHEAR